MSLNEEKVKKIHARFILEIIGRPAEHLIETLTKIIESMNSEKGISVLEKNIKEAVEMKKPEGKEDSSDKDSEKKFYTSFAEVVVEAESIMHVIMLMFKYMPANIEIIKPESIISSNNDWSEILSELARKLHGYDEIARVLQLQNVKMQKKIKELVDGKDNSSEKDKAIQKE